MPANPASSASTELRTAIAHADALLPGTPAPDDQIDPRWQALIKIGEFIEKEPLPIWEFVNRWGTHPQWDLRAGLATVLLEHLLDYDFDAIFPRVERAALRSKRVADMFVMCFRFVAASQLPKNIAKMRRLKRKLERL